MSGGSDDNATVSCLSRFGSVSLERAESLQESVLKRKTGNLLQNPSMISQCLVPCQSETVLRDKLTLWNSLIFSGASSSTAASRHSTNSPSAWGFSFLAISLLTTTKLACVTLSWSACGLDKTACWPIRLGESQCYPCALVLSTHAVMHVWRYNDAQSLSFHYCQSVPTNQAQGLAFPFHKEEFIRLFILERATLQTAPTFFFLLALSRFSQRVSSCCCHLSITEDTTWWHLCWCWGHFIAHLKSFFLN